MFRASGLAIAVAFACVAAEDAKAQTEAEPAQAASQLTDQEKVAQCLTAVANAGSDPRACVGVVADPCLEALGDSAPSEAVSCMQRETEIWDERLGNAVKELGTALGDGAPDALNAIQDSWTGYRDQRCGFGSILYPDSDFANVWQATCLLEETGRRAVEVGAILKEARSRGG